MPEVQEKPSVKLLGEDGNALAIIGACRKAWIRAKKPVEEWNDIREDMMSNDYNHLLRIAMKHFDVS